MIASRLWPNPAGSALSKISTPEPSGPRCAIESVMSASSVASARPTVPQIPHISGQLDRDAKAQRAGERERRARRREVRLGTGRLRPSRDRVEEALHLRPVALVL